jgi:hypothetical protein
VKKQRNPNGSQCVVPTFKKHKMLIIDLPDEILIHIVSFLSCLSLLSFRLTSSHLCRITNDDAFLFSHPFLRIIPFRRAFTSLGSSPVSTSHKKLNTSYLGTIFLFQHERGLSITFDSEHWIHFMHSNFVNHTQSTFNLNKCTDLPIFLRDRTIISLNSSDSSSNSHLYPSLIFKRGGSIKFKWKVYNRYPIGLFEDLGIIESFAPIYSSGRFCASLQDCRTFRVAQTIQNQLIVTHYDKNCNILSVDKYKLEPTIFNFQGCTLCHYNQTPLVLYHTSKAVCFLSPLNRTIFFIQSQRGPMYYMYYISNGIINSHICHFLIYLWDSNVKQKKFALFSFDPCAPADEKQIYKHIPPTPLFIDWNAEQVRANFFDDNTIVLGNKTFEFDPKAKKPFLKQYLKVTAFTPLPP